MHGRMRVGQAIVRASKPGTHLCMSALRSASTAAMLQQRISTSSSLPAASSSLLFTCVTFGPHLLVVLGAETPGKRSRCHPCHTKVASGIQKSHCNEIRQGAAGG